mmetsp:Transcript_28748/g.66773  ORF Transcript_28748/g.66773 Transcript_28748/m.66773 type:complete len:295 (+) Transcript_28748:72-956(+)
MAGSLPTELLTGRMQEVAEPAGHCAAQSAVYTTHLCICAVVLFMLTSEQISLDPVGTPYRKAAVCCLLSIAVLVATSFYGYETGAVNMQRAAKAAVEALWVLLNCTVAHFPSKILAEPSYKLTYFFYFCVFLVVADYYYDTHFYTSFDPVFLVNALVSIYTLNLLNRLTAMLQSSGMTLKPAYCLVRMEQVILALNIVIIYLTTVKHMTVYPLQGCLFVVYWMRIHMLLVEYGRRFVIQKSGASDDFHHAALPQDAASSCSTTPSSSGRSWAARKAIAFHGANGDIQSLTDVDL